MGRNRVNTFKANGSASEMIECQNLKISPIKVKLHSDSDKAAHNYFVETVPYLPAVRKCTLIQKNLQSGKNAPSLHMCPFDLEVEHASIDPLF